MCDTPQYATWDRTKPLEVVVCRTGALQNHMVWVDFELDDPELPLKVPIDSIVNGRLLHPDMGVLQATGAAWLRNKVS